MLVPFTLPDGSTVSLPTEFWVPEEENPSSFVVRRFLEFNDVPYVGTLEGCIFRMEANASSALSTPMRIGDVRLVEVDGPIAVSITFDSSVISMSEALALISIVRCSVEFLADHFEKLKNLFCPHPFLSTKSCFFILQSTYRIVIQMASFIQGNTMECGCPPCS